MFLKDCYRQPLLDDNKLLMTSSKHYIELAIISKEGVTRKEADEFTKKSLHGLTEEILYKKAPIALNDILKPGPDGKLIRCVLVEGAPGIGKSILAWEVCHKWEEIDSVRCYELVVLVRLREKNAQEANSLEDILPCDDATNMKELTRALGRGKGVLVVCDGFDELPCEQKKSGSVYMQLIKGTVLPEASVIITSRPSASADLQSLCQHNIDRRLEVIGFTKENIERFAQSVFSARSDILEGFLSYVTSNPPIHGIMYIPLNAAIVALIYQDEYETDMPFPTTMTQLYDALTRALIRRHIVSTQPALSDLCMPPSLQSMEDINKLPSLVAMKLLDLARVAYENILKEKYVFIDLGEDFEHYGLMKKTISLNVSIGRVCSYTFLHLTLQEYMAALYIANVCPNSIVDLASGIIMGEYRVVMRFLVGICGGNAQHPIYQRLVDILRNDSCDLLHVVHCSYESPSIMQSVLTGVRDSASVHPAVGFDWYAIGYCISHSQLNIAFIINTKTAAEEDIDYLIKGLQCSPVKKGKIEKLTVLADFIRVHTSESLTLSRIFSRLREHCQLHELCLSNVSIGSDDAVVLRQLIAPGSSLRYLTYLDRDGSDVVLLLPCLLGQTSLELLYIRAYVRSNVNLTPEHDLAPLTNTNLKHLLISGTFIQPLATSIINITFTSLKQLVIYSPSLANSEVPVFVTILQSLHTLEVLEFRSTLQTLTELSLSKLVIAIGNSHLKELKLGKRDYNRIPQQVREHYDHMLNST